VTCEEILLLGVGGKGQVWKWMGKEKINKVPGQGCLSVSKSCSLELEVSTYFWVYIKKLVFTPSEATIET
jgi:hypothetical protein